MYFVFIDFVIELNATETVCFGAFVRFYVTLWPTFDGTSFKGPCNTFQGCREMTLHLDSTSSWISCYERVLESFKCNPSDCSRSDPEVNLLSESSNALCEYLKLAGSVLHRLYWRRVAELRLCTSTRFPLAKHDTVYAKVCRSWGSYERASM